LKKGGDLTVRHPSFHGSLGLGVESVIEIVNDFRSNEDQEFARRLLLLRSSEELTNDREIAENRHSVYERVR
jgi:hypothetical protein